MARTYKRDSRGRFSGGGGGGGGGGKSRPAPRQVQRGVNRLTRDNAGRITSVGGSGATARGGRIRTAAGNLRATVTSKAGMVSQGRLTGAPLKSTIGKTSNARLNMGLTRPGKPGQREAYNAARTQLRANKPAAPKPVSSKGARLGGSRSTIRAAAPAKTVANRTGQSKTLNRFNSRPVGTMVAGKGINLVPSTKRVPLDIQRKISDEAFARIATKAARARAAAPAKAAAKQTTAQRASRAASNQKRVVASIQAKGGRRPTPSRKQRRSLMTSEAAKRFYATRAIDTLKVNVKKPGFRLPRGLR